MRDLYLRVRHYFNICISLMERTRNSTIIAINLLTSPEYYARSTKTEKMSALGLFSAILLALRLDVNLAKSVMSRTSPITKENAKLYAAFGVTWAFSTQKLLAAQQRIQQEQLQEVFAAMPQQPLLQANIGQVAMQANQLNQIQWIQIQQVIQEHQALQLR